MVWGWAGRVWDNLKTHQVSLGFAVPKILQNIAIPLDIVQTTFLYYITEVFVYLFLELIRNHIQRDVALKLFEFELSNKIFKVLKHCSAIKPRGSDMFHILLNLFSSPGPEQYHFPKFRECIRFSENL